MRNLLSYFIYSIRMLRKDAGVTAAAILALALGIGANSAIFTVVNAVLIRRLPYPDSDRIVQLLHSDKKDLVENFSALETHFVQERNRSFEAVAACDLVGSGFNVVDRGDPERVAGVRVTADFFSVLKVVPALGRNFNQEDDRPGAPGVVIISNALWQRRFGSDSSIVGRPLQLGGEQYTIVGVAPRGFQFSPAADVWIPLQAALNPNDNLTAYFVLARLRPSTTLSQAESDLRSLGEQFRRDYPALTSPTEQLTAQSYQQRLVGDIRPALLMLTAAVGLVLLIACSDVGNLLLARATAREKELGIRLALGASRARIMSQLLTESLVLTLFGAIIGISMALFVVPAILRFAPPDLPRLAEIRMDSRTLLFTLLLTAFTALLCGLIPALNSMRISISTILKGQSGRSSSDVQSRKMRNFLIVTQTALAALLLIGSGLLMRSFVRLVRIDPGFDSHNVLTMQTSLTDSEYATTANLDRFTRSILDRVESLPGVAAAATVTNLPTERSMSVPADVEGYQPASQQEQVVVQWRAVTSGYLRVMRVPLQQGRFIDNTDTPKSAPVIVVNAVLARRYWPGRSPIGQHIILGKALGPTLTDQPREVVGVVGDTREFGPDENPPATVFVPVSQVPDSYTALNNQLLPISWVIRTNSEPRSLAGNVRAQMLGLDYRQPPANVRTLDEIMENSVAPREFNMLLLGVLALIALVLGAVGIYGVVSYSVTQQTRDIGIRLALGAKRRQILTRVMGQALVLAIVGVLIGVGAALGTTPFFTRLLFEVRPTDPSTMVTVALVLAAVTCAASYMPARRAMNLDPLVALRHE